MDDFHRNQERRLIPRWRFSNTISNSAEFSGDPRKKRPSTLNKRYLEEKLFDWNAEQNIGNAIDLLSCGISGNWYDGIQPAITYLKQRNEILTPQVNELVQHALELTEVSQNRETSEQSELVRNDKFMFLLACKNATDARQKLKRDPRNVLAWLDLARAYTILGQINKAQTCVKRALFLAPTHRHVVRSAVRLYVHINEADRAHSLLIRNARTANDPWLIAAEIAVAKIAERNPKFLRHGWELIKSSGLPPEHLTELQSAIGTLEYYNGADRKARQCIRASLVAPTDNTVAQARWIKSRLSHVSIDDELLRLPLNYEARCWHALKGGSWDDAELECSKWLFDEPYSSRPALVGSCIGISLTAQFNFAVICAQVGLQAEPENVHLRNNIAVAMAYDGNMTKAIEHFNKIDPPKNSDFPKHVLVATHGLLRFRAGDIKGGQKLYTKAEILAPKEDKLRVKIFRAREELFANTKEAPKYLKDALSYKPKSDVLGTQRLQSLLQQQAKELYNHKQNMQINGVTEELLHSLKPKFSVNDDNDLNTYH